MQTEKERDLVVGFAAAAALDTESRTSSLMPCIPDSLGDPMALQDGHGYAVGLWAMMAMESMAMLWLWYHMAPVFLPAKRMTKESKAAWVELFEPAFNHEFSSGLEVPWINELLVVECCRQN